MSPAATMNRTTKRSHFHEGGTSVPAGERPQMPHIFNECGEGGAMVVDDPSICEFDGLCGEFFRKAETTDVEASGTMNSEIARDEDFWFPADLFTDELYSNEIPNTNNAAEIVSQSSRADNSTVYSDELELELFKEVPQTIDVPKLKKARVMGEGEHFSTEQSSTSTPLLASWQPTAETQGPGQFSLQASPYQAPLGPPPTMATPPPLPIVYNSVKVTKSAQVKDLLAILCENISSDPCQSVQDLMTLRLLLIRPVLTPEEDHLLDTVLILFESYLNAGRSRPDIATMVVRDFSFHLNHQAIAHQQQQQVYAAASPVLQGQGTPTVQGQYFGSFLPLNVVSPRPSISY